MQDKERELREETNPRIELNEEKIQKKRKEEGEMQNKWLKHAQENQDMSARRTHPGLTRGIQLLKHQNRHKCVAHEIRSIKRTCSYLN